MAGLPVRMTRKAVIDSSGEYRYSLFRKWKSGAGKVVFVMLNPSTADATVDDPTIRRCISFAQRWGYQSLEVVNLFALRSPTPQALAFHPDPIGPENDAYIRKALRSASEVIAAWGSNDAVASRSAKVQEILEESDSVSCLRRTKRGFPEHPLYVPGSVSRQAFTA